jgi:thiopeptide-type bacteriocin biosynthesis protein
LCAVTRDLAAVIGNQGAPPAGLDRATVVRDWLCYRLGVAVSTDVQLVITRTLPVLIARFREDCPDGRWFFVRYADRSGPHLRLRFNGALRGLDAFEQYADEVLIRTMLEFPRLLEFHKMLYVPEERKYSGRSGVTLAERVFQASSEWALALLGARFWSSRVAYAGLAVAVVLQPLPADLRASFLRDYADYWCAGRPDLRDHIAGTARRTGRELWAHVNEIAAKGQWDALESYAETVRTALTEPPWRSQPAGRIAFHLIHMTNNRLGLLPLEEALLAEVVATPGHRLGDLVAAAGLGREDPS